MGLSWARLSSLSPLFLRRAQTATWIWKTAFQESFPREQKVIGALSTETKLRSEKVARLLQGSSPPPSLLSVSPSTQGTSALAAATPGATATCCRLPLTRSPHRQQLRCVWASTVSSQPQVHTVVKWWISGSYFKASRLFFIYAIIATRPHFTPPTFPFKPSLMFQFQVNSMIHEKESTLVLLIGLKSSVESCMTDHLSSANVFGNNIPPSEWWPGTWIKSVRQHHKHLNTNITHSKLSFRRWVLCQQRNLTSLELYFSNFLPIKQSTMLKFSMDGYTHTPTLNLWTSLIQQVLIGHHLQPNLC